MASVWVPVVILPLAEKVNVLIPGLLFNARPFVLPRVRLFSSKTLAGTSTPVALPPNTRLEPEVVVRLPGVPAMAGPFKVRALDPTAKVPLVSVSVPPTVWLAPIVVPTALARVRLLKVVIVAPPMPCALVPSSVTVPVRAVNVAPLLIQSPARFSA